MITVSAGVADLADRGAAVRRHAAELAGRQAQVTGKAWLDHEWSSELLPPNAQGWDWVGLNFHDGTSLMAFRMRGLDGVPIWSAATDRVRPAGTATTAVV